MNSYFVLVCSICFSFSWTGLSKLVHKDVNPCKSNNHKVLSEPDRAAGFIIIDQPHNDKDEFNASTAWYRFNGSAGDRMANRCVPYKHCGTEATGWLKGPHPSKKEGIVNRTVCFRSGYDCCFWSIQVKVQNCSGFYVYQLKRNVPGAYENYRYCGNGNEPDPCDRRFYKVLDEDDRARGFVTGSVIKCDLESEDAGMYNRWSRFNGSAGVAMPTKCVDKMRCGAEAPGWLRDKHPRVNQGVVTRKVCYHWGGDCCFYKNDIQVKNCGDFFVYKFERPPASYLRYCGNGKGPSKSSNPDTCEAEVESVDYEENPCLTGEYTELSEQDRAAGYLATGRERCDGSKFAKKEAWYRFTGNAGCRMAEGCVPGKHCSSGAAGWLNGSHPRDEDEGAVNRTVCFRWKDDCCKRKIQIKVRKCAGNFFLYLLKRNPWKKVSCSYRYCGNGEGPPHIRKVPTTKGPTPTKTPSTAEGPTSTKAPPTKVSVRPSQPPTPPKQEEVDVKCGKNEMWISIPKYILHGLDREHLRLADEKCTATETKTHFILHTNLTDCHTRKRHTKNFVCYMNTVLEIPVAPNQIITRVREVEIPFSCYYSNMGVVSAVGLKVQSKKIIFSKKGFGKFVLEMKIFPTNKFIFPYRKEDFPIYVPLRKVLYIEVSVDSKDTRLAVLAEECFATPDPNPNKPGLRYTFIKNGCKQDDTVTFIQTEDKQTQHFSIEAFSFLGDHQFVFMHCRVKICNATDPQSRCAQGCLQQRRKRSLWTNLGRDEEYSVSHGPFMRKDEEEQVRDVPDSTDDLLKKDIKGDESNPTLIIAMALTSAICVTGMTYMLWSKKKQTKYGYRPLTQTKLD